MQLPSRCPKNTFWFDPEHKPPPKKNSHPCEWFDPIKDHPAQKKYYRMTISQCGSPLLNPYNIAQDHRRSFVGGGLYPSPKKPVVIGGCKNFKERGSCFSVLFLICEKWGIQNCKPSSTTQICIFVLDIYGDGSSFPKECFHIRIYYIGIYYT